MKGFFTSHSLQEKEEKEEEKKKKRKRRREKEEEQNTKHENDLTTKKKGKSALVGKFAFTDQTAVPLPSEVIVQKNNAG